MTREVIQTSFASGEWAPKLRARVDIQKFRSGAALLRNFFVDYAAGGASTRQGTRFINQCAALGSRLIPFQPSSSLSYVLEFGQNYIRFYSNGAVILSGGVPYQIASQYNASDLFPNQATGNPGLKFVQNVTSMIITHPAYPAMVLTIVSATDWTLTPVTYGPTIATPTGVAITTNLSTEADGWNYAYLVTAVDVNGQESTPSTPALLTGYEYIGSSSSIGTNSITWTATPGAQSYNVYKASPAFDTAIPSGSAYGFIGNVTGTAFLDTYPGIGPDFSQTPPIAQDPFLGAGVQSYAITAPGTYTTVPTVTVSAPSAGQQATVAATLGVTANTLDHSGAGYDIQVFLSNNPTGGLITLPNGVILTITSATNVGSSDLGFFWAINSCTIYNPGSIASGSTPSNPISPLSCNVPTFVSFAGGFGFTLTWGVTQILSISPGAGYTAPPTVSFSSGAAAATATLATASGGNPGVCGFFQERLVLASQSKAVQSYNLSQPGSFFNFNISNPSEDSDAITGTIISEQLNDIRNLLSVPTGMIALTGKGAWLINGGGGVSTSNPITPADQSATPQAFNGANDLQPQRIGLDFVYCTNKGAYFRDMAYNIYANTYTGEDMSVLSNHLFFSYNFVDISWSEEPFKLMYVVRNDGTLLTLSFVKEQELVGWSHHDTNGQFKSVCSVIETINGNVVDATYVIVNRPLDAENNNYVEYVERFADRYFVHGYYDSWSVDCGLQSAPAINSTDPLVVNGDISKFGNSIAVGDFVNGQFTPEMVGWYITTADGGVYEATAYTNQFVLSAVVLRPPNSYNTYINHSYPVSSWQMWAPVTTVSGLTQLQGLTVTGVANGAVVPPQVVSDAGTITLTTPAHIITLGLAFTPQLMTLPLDLGEPTVQGKRKKLSGLTLRVADTLGLEVGATFNTLVTVKDFQLGAIPSNSTGPGQQVIDLVNTSYDVSQLNDGRTILDAVWQERGQFCIQQSLPYPASILGVIPEVTLGDK